MDLCSSQCVAVETRGVRQTPYDNTFFHNKIHTALEENELGPLYLDANTLAIRVCFIHHRL
jgi:hypothetical protein